MLVDKIIRTFEKQDLPITGARIPTRRELEPIIKEVRATGRMYWTCTSTGGDDHSHLFIVNEEGLLNYCEADRAYVWVKPILELGPRVTDIISIGGHFMYGMLEFEIISDKLALCTSYLGWCTYRTPDSARHDDYASSRVKKVVDKWFEEQILPDTSGDGRIR